RAARSRAHPEGSRTHRPAEASRQDWHRREKPGSRRPPASRRRGRHHATKRHGIPPANAPAEGSGATLLQPGGPASFVVPHLRLGSVYPPVDYRIIPMALDDDSPGRHGRACQCETQCRWYKAVAMSDTAKYSEIEALRNGRRIEIRALRPADHGD